MKTWPWLKLAGGLVLILGLSGCNLSVPFEVVALRVVPRDQAGAIMGSDWARWNPVKSLPPTMVLVELTSKVDLAKYAQEKQVATIAFDVWVNLSPKRRPQLDLREPWVYSGGQRLGYSPSGAASPVVKDGLYHYQIMLASPDGADGISELLQEGTSLSLQVWASNMIQVYRSKDILLTKAMLRPSPQGS